MEYERGIGLFRSGKGSAYKFNGRQSAYKAVLPAVPEKMMEGE
jgi:hypothetical protein